jgi:WD40 repeat protein
VYDVTANKLKAPFLGVHKSSATAVEFSQKNGMLMCSAGLDGKINLYDVEDRK